MRSVKAILAGVGAVLLGAAAVGVLIGPRLAAQHMAVASPARTDSPIPSPSAIPTPSPSPDPTPIQAPPSPTPAPAALPATFSGTGPVSDLTFHATRPFAVIVSPRTLIVAVQGTTGGRNWSWSFGGTSEGPNSHVIGSPLPDLPADMTLRVVGIDPQKPSSPLLPADGVAWVVQIQ